MRLRTVNGRVVHRGDIDTGLGITTVCGNYALAGRYIDTDDTVTCRICLRILARQHRD